MTSWPILEALVRALVIEEKFRCTQVSWFIGDSCYARDDSTVTVNFVYFWVSEKK